MSFWQDWSDGKKWVMGIASALTIASLIAVVTRLGSNNNALPETRSPAPSPSTHVDGFNSNQNSSNRGDLSVNASNAAPIKPVPSSNEDTSVSAEPATGHEIFNNWNDPVMGNQPTQTILKIDKRFMIKNIYDLHTVEASLPAEGISLRSSAGRIYGPWEIHPGDGQNRGTWGCSPLTPIPAGIYTVIDPDPASWLQNANHQGKTQIVGYATSGKTK